MRKATAPKQQTVIGPLKTGSGHLVVKDDVSGDTFMYAEWVDGSDFCVKIRPKVHSL